MLASMLALMLASMDSTLRRGGQVIQGATSVKDSLDASMSQCAGLVRLDRLNASMCVLPKRLGDLEPP